MKKFCGIISSPSFQIVYLILAMAEEGFADREEPLPALYFGPGSAVNITSSILNLFKPYRGAKKMFCWGSTTRCKGLWGRIEIGSIIILTNKKLNGVYAATVIGKFRVPEGLKPLWIFESPTGDPWEYGYELDNIQRIMSWEKLWHHYGIRPFITLGSFHDKDKERILYQRLRKKHYI